MEIDDRGMQHYLSYFLKNIYVCLKPFSSIHFLYIQNRRKNIFFIVFFLSNPKNNLILSFFYFSSLLLSFSLFLFETKHACL